MLNDALFYESYEIIGGKKMAAAAANPFHGSIIGELHTVFNTYLRSKKCGRVFTDNVDVHFPDGNVFKPDLVVLTSVNLSIIDWKRGLYGVPDLVVEVLSKSTMQRDLTIKKDVYESNGVKEYWIIDPWKESIAVYLLRDGKFELDAEYIYYNQEEWEDLKAEQRAEAKFEIKVSIFKDCIVNINDIFDWLHY